MLSSTILHVFYRSRVPTIQVFTLVKTTNGDWKISKVLVIGSVREEILTNILQNLKIDFQTLSEDRIEFDLVGVDASIANALRRILIAEVSA